jgi:hypothetical protein
MPLHADQLIAQKVISFVEEVSDRIDKILDEKFSITTPKVTFDWRDVLTEEEWVTLTDLGQLETVIEGVMKLFGEQMWAMSGGFSGLSDGLTMRPMRLAKSPSW